LASSLCTPYTCLVEAYVYGVHVSNGRPEEGRS
jgi:hypothetical protein